MINIFLRSLIFNVLFYLNLVGWFLAAYPATFFSLSFLMKYARGWARTSNWLLRNICNVRVEVRGRENIVAGPLIVASKHQSLWDTFAMFEHFELPLYIYKRELGRIPLFGTLLRSAKMISVDRSGGGRALVEMTRLAGEEVRRGRQLIIFPEGTRRPVGAPPQYKRGFVEIYAEAGVPCLPVALNSGLFWPRRSFMRYPGTIVIEFLEVLGPGLPKDGFSDEVSARIEAASNRIIAEGRAEQVKLFGGRPQDRPAA